MNYCCICLHATHLVLLAVDGDRVHAADIGHTNVLVAQQVVGSCRHAAYSDNRPWKRRMVTAKQPVEHALLLLVMVLLLRDRIVPANDALVKFSNCVC